MNLNCWLGCGRLTKDAEMSTTKKGTTMTKFRLAVNDRRGVDSDGKKIEDTLFVNVLCFGKMAEVLQPKLVKGRIISVQGKVKIDEYEDAEKNKRSSVCILADEISLGPSPDSIVASAKEE